MSIDVRLVLILDDRGKTLAFLSLDGTRFLDPYGGEFSEDEQAGLRRVMAGEVEEITLMANTRLQRTRRVRLAIRLEKAS